MYPRSDFNLISSYIYILYIFCLCIQGVLDPQRCTVVFLDSHPTTGALAYFQLHLNNAHCEPCRSSHNTDIVGHLKSLADGSTAKITLKSQIQAICTLSYKPTQRGWHQLIVSINGEALADSPFPLYIRDPSSDPVNVIGGPQYPTTVTLCSYL